MFQFTVQVCCANTCITMVVIKCTAWKDATVFTNVFPKNECFVK